MVYKALNDLVLACLLNQISHYDPFWFTKLHPHWLYFAVFQMLPSLSSS